MKKTDTPGQIPSSAKMYGVTHQRPDIGRAYQSLLPAIQKDKAEYLAIAQKGYPGARLKPGEADGLLSVGNMATRDKQPLNMDHFRLQGVMFILNFQGVLAVKVNHTKYLVYPGELLIMPPVTRFAIGDPVMSCVRLGWLLVDVQAKELCAEWTWPGWLMLDIEEKEALSSEIKRRGVSVNKVPEDFVQVYTRLTMLSAHEKIPYRGSRLRQMVSQSMLELLDFFQRAGDKGVKMAPPSLRTVQEFLAHLPEHLAEPWTVETMAEACGIGVSKFSEQVRLVTAESPAKYLSRLRLEKACKLLKETSLPLSAIAKELGFSCSSYFIRAFTRLTRQSPTRFRVDSLR